MKKLAVFILLLAFMAPAQYLFHRRIAFRSAGAPPPANGTVLLALETFDTNPGYDQPGWGEAGGTPNEDYTTTVLAGTQSFYSNGGYATNTFTAADSVTVSQLIKFPESVIDSSDWPAFYAYNEDNEQTAWNRLETSGPQWYFRPYMGTPNGGGTEHKLTRGGADAKTFYWWHEIIKGTGADGVYRYYLSEFPERPPHYSGGVFTGDKTAKINSIRISGSSGAPMIMDNVKVVAGVTGEYSRVFDETLEGTGYVEAGWVETAGTVNEDYTTTVLAGAQSLFLSGGGTATNSLGATLSDGWLKFRFRATGSFGSALADGPVYLRDAAGNNVVQVRWDDNGANGRFTLYQGTVSASTPQTLNLSTTYVVWVYFKASTGSNDGIARLFYQNFDTIPAVAEAVVTTGDNTASVSNIYVTQTSSVTYILDNLVVYDTP